MDREAFFWTPEWQAGEAEADEALAEGRYTDFDSVDDAIRHLLQDERTDR